MKSQGKKLSSAFYLREDVVQISRDLIGSYLCTNINGAFCKGKIVETEAYCGATDKACHAYNGKRTKRTETMYKEAGISYVYLCYGMHHLFNVVTNAQDFADAVLIRAIEPSEGIPTMLKRRAMSKVLPRITAGPACLTKALGINLDHNEIDLFGEIVWIEEGSDESSQIIESKRIGIDYAGEDADLPWRFCLKDSAYLSKKP